MRLLLSVARPMRSLECLVELVDEVPLVDLRKGHFCRDPFESFGLIGRGSRREAKAGS